MEGLARTLRFDGAYAAGSSEGLGMFWKRPLSLDLRNYSKYHIDMEVKEGDKDPWRITSCRYTEANRILCHKTWEMMRFIKADIDPLIMHRSF